MIKITNLADSATVQIFGEIGESFWSDGWTLEKFTNQIKGLQISNLTIELKSNGGDLMEGFAIYDAIKNLPARVTVKIVGASASAATVIASGADRIEISENSRYLVHNAMTFVEGNKEDMKEVYEQLASFDNQILDIYIKRTGKPRNELAELMKAEKWMTAEEAKEWGFVDEIIKSKIENKMAEDKKNVKNLTEEEQAEMDALMAENEALKTQVSELQAQLDEINAAEEAKEEEMIEEEVTAAIESGKIKAEAKDSWIAFGKADHVNMTASLEAINYTSTNTTLKDVVTESSVPTMTKELFWSNYKSGKYKDKIEEYKADYKKAFGKEPKI